MMARLESIFYDSRSIGIKHIIPKIEIRGTRLIRVSRVHLGTRDGVTIQPVRADRLANLTAQFKKARLTLNDVANLADGGEVKGVSCDTLGIKREDAQAVLIIQAASLTAGARLPESAKRAVGHVFNLARKRLEEIASR